MKTNWLVLPLTRDYFGKRTIELAGIIIHPELQGYQLGSQLVSELIAEERPSGIVAYTRNPALLRAVGHACGRADVLDCNDPAVLATDIPHATLEDDGQIYHIGRYAPDGLYGSFDPAKRDYRGVPLDERCKLLKDEVNALAISVETGVN
jgi:hypothetical protein